MGTEDRIRPAWAKAWCGFVIVATFAGFLVLELDASGSTQEKLAGWGAAAALAALVAIPLGFTTLGETGRPSFFVLTGVPLLLTAGAFYFTIDNRAVDRRVHQDSQLIERSVHRKWILVPGFLPIGRIAHVPDDPGASYGSDDVYCRALGRVEVDCASFSVDQGKVVVNDAVHLDPVESHCVTGDRCGELFDLVSPQYPAFSRTLPPA